MGMYDGRPFIPKTGAPITIKHRNYVLRWVPEYGRTLFSKPWATGKIADKPSYRLVPMTECCAGSNDTLPHKPCDYHFYMYSIRTGKRVQGEAITCYMVRVHENEHTPKRPWWHDGRSTFHRNEPWHL